MTNGKWTCSTNEEHWNCCEEFDTRDEALAYAISGFAKEYNIDDGDNVWVGQIRKIVIDDIAEHGVDTWRVVENITERIYELVGDEVAIGFKITKEHEADLETRMTAAIRDWMTAHDLKPTCYTLDHIESHSFERCEEHDGAGDAGSRCVLHLEHEGVHEWP